MLKYKFKVNDSSITQQELVWREKYISPDLSMLSGVTSTDYHLERYASILVRNNYFGIQSSNSIYCETVTRQGYIVVKKKPYEIISGNVTTYKTSIFDSGGTEVLFGSDTGDTGDNGDYQCVFINGKYYYKVETESHGECFMITDFLVEQGGRPIEKTIYSTEIKSDANVNKLLIDTIYWIEDGLVNIDGDIYIFNLDEGSDGTLRYFENGVPLKLNNDNDGNNEIIPGAKGIELHPYSRKDYEEVCKFSIGVNEYTECSFDGVSCGNYYYYVFFKDNYLKVRETTLADKKFMNENDEKYTDESNTIMFVCEVPQYILSPFDKKEEQLEPLLYPIRDYNKEILTKENAKKLNIFSLQDLRKIASYIIIDKSDLLVANNIQSSNSGDLLLIYLGDNSSGVRPNDEVSFYDLYNNVNEEIVYDLYDYDGIDADDTFVLYNGKKCKVYENLCDMALVPTKALSEAEEAKSAEEKIELGLCEEFSIEYVNGKVNGKDALVNFYGEMLPMRLKLDDTDPNNPKWQLRKYGRETVDTYGDGKVRASDVLYDINPHDGILVNGRPYVLKTKETVINGQTLITKTVSIGETKERQFNVNGYIGSSLLVCEPIIPNNLTRSFTSYMSKLITYDVIENQSSLGLHVKNKVLGYEDITEDLGWSYRYHNLTKEDSLLWFYTEKYNPKILVPVGHILIPLNLNVNYANNTIQDDIVNDQFYRVEKEKAINDIVDMEKDVYSPVYIINGAYKGSSTEFSPIYEINLNFHFRTRTLDNWKVNERYNSAESLSADTDNWFVTDFHPYKDMISKGRGGELMDSSDLMGLLNFTYDDVFYQKSKVAKSFVRLSLYDSIDPQAQSLLDTSSVFVDEHSLYKKLIDNSRKNVNAFGLVKAPEMEYTANTQGQMTSADTSKPDVVYKISLMTEFLGENKKDNYDNIKNYKKRWDSGASVVLFDEPHRISSRLTIKNKYQTDTSSEGFYHYIFREYSEDLHPKPIYMKIEYNHAGIGKTIPMLVPMKWEDEPTTATESDFANKKMFPVTALTLSDDNDIKDLKKGIPLSYLYSQLYIPFYAVYDFINKQYVYVIDERYLTEDNKDILHKKGILNIDLFEMKVMNEVEDPSAPPTDPRKQKVGRININEKMFPINYFNK